MKTEALSYQFTEQDQEWFCQVSGDFNPIHTSGDEAAAIALEGVVVHGMHAVLVMLEAYFSLQPLLNGSLQKLSIKATFHGPVIVGDEVKVKYSTVSGEKQLALEKDGTILARIRIAADFRPFPKFSGRLLRTTIIDKTPLDPDLDAPERLSGVLAPLQVQSDSFSKFPKTLSRLGIGALCEISRLSAIVGMIWPGRRSMLAEVLLKIETQSDQGWLAFEAIDLDRRFNVTNIHVKGANLAALATAFIRPNRITNPSLKRIESDLSPEMSADLSSKGAALIVGGTKGLGEVTAKIISAFGKEIIITYSSNSALAERIRDEVIDSGRRCSALKYDVVTDKGKKLSPECTQLISRVTTLYYFATPTIFVRRGKYFNHELFSKFVCFYADSFIDTVRMVRSISQCQTLRVFYPSSVAVDERPRDLLEYFLAKQVGEGICAHIEDSVEGVEIIVERLPRVLTSQTNSIPSVKFEMPLDTMLPVVRSVELDK